MMQSSVSVCYSCFVKKFLDNIHVCLNCCLLIGCYKCLKSLACREVLKFIFLLFSTAKSKSWMVSLTSVSVSLLSIQPYLVCHTQVLFFFNTVCDPIQYILQKFSYSKCLNAIVMLPLPGVPPYHADPFIRTFTGQGEMFLKVPGRTLLHLSFNGFISAYELAKIYFS